MRQPPRKASVRAVPETPELSASVPSGFCTATEVRNTTTTRGIRIRAIVLNWRRR